MLGVLLRLLRTDPCVCVWLCGWVCSCRHRRGAESGEDRLDAAIRLVAIRAGLLQQAYRQGRGGSRHDRSPAARESSLVAVCKSPLFRVQPASDDVLLAGVVAVANVTTRQVPIFGPALPGMLRRPPLPRHSQGADRMAGRLTEAAISPLTVVQSVVLPARKGSPFCARVAWAMPGRKRTLPQAWALSRASPAEARAALGAPPRAAATSGEPVRDSDGRAWAIRSSVVASAPPDGSQLMSPPDWGKMSAADAALAARLDARQHCAPETNDGIRFEKDVLCLDDPDAADGRAWESCHASAAGHGAGKRRGLRPWLAQRARHRHTQLTAAGEAITLSPMSGEQRGLRRNLRKGRMGCTPTWQPKPAMSLACIACSPVKLQMPRRTR